MINEIADIGQEVGFNEVDSVNVLELLNSHCKEMRDNDLINVACNAIMDALEGENTSKSEMNLQMFQNYFRISEELK